MARISGMSFFVLFFSLAVFGQPSGEVTEPAAIYPGRFIEEQLVKKGLSVDMARNLAADPRISIRKDVAILNLFYSSPAGSTEEPSVMKIDPKLISQGRIFIRDNAASLAAVEQKFGTSPALLTAILIVESRLGTCAMKYKAVDAFFSLALMLDPKYLKELQAEFGERYPQLHEETVIAKVRRRAAWALNELYNLGVIAGELGIDPLSIDGSFSGAMGPAQFIPSTFQSYGLDGDNDGKRNPFIMADAYASMGNYLQKSGWSETAPLDKKRRAIWQYNHSTVYVNTIMMLYEDLRSTEVTVSGM